MVRPGGGGSKLNCPAGRFPSGPLPVIHPIHVSLPMGLRLPDCPAMNFARDVVDAAPAGRRALVEIDREGRRREFTFGEVADASARLAGALTDRGIAKGDVVMTVIGNRPQWVLTMVACFRIGAVALPCNEQLRAKDLRQRLAAARPKLILADERNAGELAAAASDETRMRIILIPNEELLASPPAPAVDLAPA